MQLKPTVVIFNAQFFVFGDKKIHDIKTSKVFNEGVWYHIALISDSDINKLSKCPKSSSKNLILPFTVLE
jgi:hypothetical protein